MGKINQKKIIKILSGCLIFLIVVLIGIILFKYEKPTPQQEHISLKLNKSAITLNLPTKESLSTKQNPVIVYRTEKQEDGSEVEIYTQQKDYENLDTDNLSKLGVILSDETTVTFEIYKTKDKNPLEVVSDTKTFKNGTNKITYGMYKANEKEYCYYLTMKESNENSILISINSDHKMNQDNLSGIVDWITFN